MKEELKKDFDIDIENIEPKEDFFNQLNKALEELKSLTNKDRFEVILNENLIKSKEKYTNYRTILGCRISYADLDKNISFVVKEDTEPSYEELVNRIVRVKEEINKMLCGEYEEKTFIHKLCMLNEILYGIR